MAIAYRMSAEIADWLNRHAALNEIDAVELVGIRPTGLPVREVDAAAPVLKELNERWSTTALITAQDVWDHKGFEYDVALAGRTGMGARELYLAASRAAHQLLLTGEPQGCD